MTMKNLQVIALMDCDSFFVSCEQLDNPDLKNKPVCVLGNNDGCVISRSKEAKAMGVKMGMPYFMAKKEFPNAIYISSRYQRYVDISKNIMAFLMTFSPTIEQYSIDEAFIDLTGLRRLYRRSYVEIARMIRTEILSKIGIPVSIGISTTKTLAKLASNKAKKTDGVHIIGYRAIKSELQNTELADIWGVGKNTAALMAKYGIKTAYEFSQQSDEWLRPKLGIRGVQMREELCGNSVFKVNNSKILPKSIQNTRSFANFTSNKNYIKNSLIYHINNSCFRLRELGLKAGCVKVVLRTKDFRYFVEKKLFVSPTDWDTDVVQTVIPLFEKIYNKNEIYRSSGIVLENLIKSEDLQMSLFSNSDKETKKEYLSQCIDKLTKRFKKNIVKIGYAESPKND